MPEVEKQLIVVSDVVIQSAQLARKVIDTWRIHEIVVFSIRKPGRIRLRIEIEIRLRDGI